MPWTLRICLVTLFIQGCGGKSVPGSIADGGSVADAGADRTSPPKDAGGQLADLLACSVSWSCSAGPDGRYICNSESPGEGLPPGGRDWMCHPVKYLSSELIWICVGEAAPGGTAPGGCGWECRPFVMGSLFLCEKADGPEDNPPGGISLHHCQLGEEGDCYACVKGSAYSGTSCERVELPDGHCLPGDRMWCDGPVYDGWGQVECDPKTGMWKTTIINGKSMIDCQEALADGHRPNTVCACYSFFTHFSCCERLDCVVPAGTQGQICPPSSGELCAHCNPLASECVEPGARCITTNAMESFCGRDCSSNPCPSGYTCMDIDTKGSEDSTRQCVPEGLSCYFM